LIYATRGIFSGLPIILIFKKIGYNEHKLIAPENVDFEKNYVEGSIGEYK